LTADAAVARPRSPVAPVVRPVAYPLPEAARLLRKSPRTLRRLYDAGKMPGKWLGQSLMVPSDWVHAYGTWPRDERVA